MFLIYTKKMSGTLYSYNKQQFNSDVSFNSNTALTGATTISGVSTHSGRAIFTTDVSLNGSTTISGATTFTAANTIINGNVGIGLTNPAQKLDIQAASPEILLRPNNGIDAFWGIQAKTGNAGILIGNADGNGTITGNQLSILNNGNVGVGTTNPGAKFQVGTSGNSISLDNTAVGSFGAVIYIDSTGGSSGRKYSIFSSTANSGGGAGKLSFFDETASQYRMVIDSGGNVGIGTTNPEYKCEAYGSFAVRNATNDVLGLFSPDHGGYIMIGAWNKAGSYSKNIVLNQYGGNVGIGTTNPLSLLCLNRTYSTSDYRTDKSNKISFLTNIQSYYVDGVGVYSAYDVPSIGHSITFLPQSYDDVGSGNGGYHGKLLFNFESSNDSAGLIPLTLTSNGRVGIGTTNPGYPLQVLGYKLKNYADYAGYYYFGTLYSTLTSGGDFVYGEITKTTITNAYSMAGAWIGVFSQYSFYTDAAFMTASDKRIKTNIVDIDDEKALQTLRLIKPKTYDYIDKLERGSANVIGFIAQEIKEIIPKAVTIVKQYIPNFMTVCQVSATDASNIVLVTSPIDLSWNPLHDQSGNAFVDADGNPCSDASGNKVFNVKLYDQSNNEITCKTTSILDKRSFLIDVTGSKMVDASGNLVLEKDGGYFLHGQEVDDFNSLDKQAIFTVVTAAVQDIDRQVQAQAVKQQAQEAKIAALESKNAELEAKLAAFEARLAALE